MKLQWGAYAFLLFAVAIFSCCGPAQPPDLVPTPMNLEYRQPAILAVEGYPEIQSKQDVTISVIPQGFTKIMNKSHECEWVRSKVGEFLDAVETDQDPNEELTYLVKEIPSVHISPQNISFKITINNNLARVLRLAGSIMAMQVDGKNIGIDSTRYKDFLDGFVLPRQQVDYDIAGPNVADLPLRCNISLFLYDVITDVDPAGNATKKANFEWFFTYENQIRSEPASVTKRIVKMTPAQAAQMRRRY